MRKKKIYYVFLGQSVSLVGILGAAASTAISAIFGYLLHSGSILANPQVYYYKACSASYFTAIPVFPPELSTLPPPTPPAITLPHPPQSDKQARYRKQKLQ
jgi:hypothetical protein